MLHGDSRRGDGPRGPQLSRREPKAEHDFKRFKDSRRHRAETTANLYIQKYRKKDQLDTSVQHLLKRMNK